MLKVAKKLDEYLRRRAAVEGVSYELDAAFLAQLVAKMRRSYGSGTLLAFGVHIDGEQLISDEQEPAPGFFEEWKQSNSSANKGRGGLLRDGTPARATVSSN